MSTELGKYEVLGKLALTETAELFVARTTGTSTPQRFVVLKRLKREVAADIPRAKAFIARSRLASRIEHPNVAQVLEVGKLGASFYCAMEFVDGESASAIIQHARGKKIPIPVRVVLAIAAGAATGMRHAHELKGEGGNVLGIVHGDIATHSVMVSRDGVVKLVGFGIAQDATTTDRATDLAGLGAVLWELLTLQPIENGAVAPSSKRLDVPKELDAIVLKLLGKTGKYDYAGEVLAEIEGLAARLDIAISTQDLARAMRLWFPDSGAGNGEELRSVVVAAEQTSGDIEVAAPGGAIDQMLDDVRTNAGAIRSAVAAAVAQPSTRRRASTAVPANATAPTAERETFEQIRDRIMANARPKTPTGSAATEAGGRKKSDTLNPTLNQYSYITAVGGKDKEPLRSVTSDKSEPMATEAQGEIAARPVAKVAVKSIPVEPADTDKMDAAARAELEARARAVAEEALRSEQKAKMLAEQRARAEVLKEQARNRAEHEERVAARSRNDAKAKAVAEATAALSGSMPAASDPEPPKAGDFAEDAKHAEHVEQKANGAAEQTAADEAAAKAEADDKAAAAEAEAAAEAAAEAKAAAAKAKAEADEKAAAKAKAKAALEAPDDEDTSAPADKPKWLLPVGIGAVAVVAVMIFVFTRGGDKPKEAPPPPPPPVKAAVVPVAADAAIQVAVTPDAPVPADAPMVVATPADAAQVAVAPPADAAKVEAAPPDAAQVADTHKPPHHADDTPKPPQHSDDTRSIPELFAAGELAKVNKACTTTTRFNSQVLRACGLSACTAKDVALAKRWANALSGPDRAEVVAKCTASGVDVSQ